jgi:hypothetical protein
MMKTNKRYKVPHGKVGSLQELELEKARLRLEIMKSEENIRSDYRRLMDAFTLRNLATGLMDDIAVTSNVFSKAISVGKSIFAKRKKKKKLHEEAGLPLTEPAIDPADISVQPTGEPT